MAFLLGNEGNGMNSWTHRDRSWEDFSVCQNLQLCTRWNRKLPSLSKLQPWKILINLINQFSDKCHNKHSESWGHKHCIL